MMSTTDPNEAKDIAVMMTNTVKGKICSLPVKKQICEILAKMITSRQNFMVRL